MKNTVFTSSGPRVSGWLLALASALGGCGGGDDNNPPAPPTSEPDPDISLADVSVLLPLPASKDDPAWLRLDAEAKGGALLPAAHLASAMKDFGIGNGDGLAYDKWRIVAARLDQCFPSAALLITNPTACRQQIRLVAQPVDIDPNGLSDYIATDNAIHLLYDLDAASFATAAAQWKTWAKQTPANSSAPLGIHPDLASGGLDSTLGVGLSDLITSNVGEANLGQVTFMFVKGRSSGWIFGGYKVQAGALVPFDAHNTGSHTQELLGVFGTPLEISPRSPLATTILALAEAMPGELAGTEAEVAAATALATAIENPTTVHNPDSVDCVTCHVAGRLRKRALFLGAADVPSGAFTAEGYNLANTTTANLAADPTMVRTFGYLGTTMLLGDRVIHESAEVAAWLSAQ